MIEKALIVALIVGALFAFAPDVKGLYSEVSSNMPGGCQSEGWSPEACER